MILRRKYILLLSLLNLATPVCARADLTIKKNILENCAAALEQLAQLPKIEAEALVPYLSQVLRLETSALGQVTRLPLPLPLPVPGPAKSTLDTKPDTQISRTLDPDREIDAKRCAITALKSLNALARDAIPDLISLARSSLTPEELRFQAEEAIRLIAVDVGKMPVPDVPASFLARVLELTARVGPPYPENVLLELRSASLPFLLTEFRKSEPAHREAIEKLLQQLDSPTTGITQTLLPSLTSADDSLRKRVLKLLPRLNGSKNEAIGAIFHCLHDLSDDIRRVAADAFAYLADRVVAEPEQLTPDIKELLVQGVRSPSDYVRQPAERILTAVAEMPEFPIPSLLKALEVAEPSARQTALVLLSLKHPLPPDVFRKTLELLYDPNVAVRQTAVRELSKERERADEVILAFTKLLKSDVLKRSTDARRLIVWEIATALDRLAPHPRAAALVPFFVEAISEGDSIVGTTLEGQLVQQTESLSVLPSENALVKIGQNSIAPLVKLLRAQNDQAQGRAIRVLGRMTALDGKDVRLIVPLLKDQSPIVFEQAVLALRAHKARASAELQRSLRTATGQNKLGISLILWPEQKLLEASTLETQLADLSCSTKTSLLPLVAEPNLAVRLPVLKVVRPCFLSEATAPSEALLNRIAPLVPDDQNEFLALLQNETLSPALRLRLLERASALGIPGPAMTSFALQLLGARENTIRVRAAQFLGKLGGDAGEAVGKLQEILGNRDEEERLQDEAFIALYRIRNDALPFDDFLLDELRGDRYAAVFSILERLDLRTTIAVLNKGAEPLPSERLVPLVRIAGKLGSEAKDAVPALEQVSQRPSSELRFEATIARLKIDPRPEIAGELLQRELGSYFFERVVKDDFPPALLPAVEEIAVHPKSVVAEIAAREILRRAKKNQSTGQ